MTITNLRPKPSYLWPIHTSVQSDPLKLLALFSDIRQNFTHKSIVLFCWKKTLDLAAELFQNQGIRYNMIDGSLPLAERIKVLKAFQSLTGANILLMTLGTGAGGQVVLSLV
ncbi:hypothetical protein F4803DRAFT_225864 [Xylaria telfairii]|nr:hypothetical protein F4803DRAFT_225864 [Xylaria telfairii]